MHIDLNELVKNWPTIEENKKDFRLVFEIEFYKQLFSDYKPIELKIWRAFTDTTVEKLLEE